MKKCYKSFIKGTHTYTLKQSELYNPLVNIFFFILAQKKTISSDFSLKNHRCVYFLVINHSL